MIIRDCDTIYQKLFTNEGMPIKVRERLKRMLRDSRHCLGKLQEGCHRFDTVVHGVREKGEHCACRCPDNCNAGNMTEVVPCP